MNLYSNVLCLSSIYCKWFPIVYNKEIAVLSKSRLWDPSRKSVAKSRSHGKRTRTVKWGIAQGLVDYDSPVLHSGNAMRNVASLSVVEGSGGGGVFKSRGCWCFTLGCNNSSGGKPIFLVAKESSSAAREEIKKKINISPQKLEISIFYDKMKT